MAWLIRSLLLLLLISPVHAERFSEFDTEAANRIIDSILRASQRGDVRAYRRWLHTDVEIIHSVGDNRDLERLYFDKELYLQWLQSQWDKQRKRSLTFEVSSIEVEDDGHSALVKVIVNERFTVGRKTESFETLQRYRIIQAPSGRLSVTKLMTLSVYASS